MIAFSIGSLDIYRYGIFYVITFFIAYLFLYYVGKSSIFSKYPKVQNFFDKNLDDLVLFSILGVLVGGRLGHVIIYDLNHYLQYPVEIFQFWKGGMSFIGGMIGVLLTLFILAKRKGLKRSDLIILFDCILCIAPLGITIGRIGNFLNQELYGIKVPSDFWGLSSGLINLLEKLNVFYVYDKIDIFLRINTNFLASFFEGFISLVVTLSIFFVFKKRGKFRVGYITGIFLLWYSFVRFLLEYIRFDSQSEFVFHLTKSQRFFVIFFIVGLYFVIFEKKKISIK
ncbi:prolipoprotein diacylglyceryl transferase [Candidatus Gracilibacteria bacterium]|nr:prolipoprotein diacylglyceryl transferase [Candidatus Gracilibacteria bacterium]